MVHAHGIAGDVQRNRVLHGGPNRAVCLYSLDLIHALQAEGHPIGPGATGENLTLAGLDWSALVRGARVEVADVLLEVTSFAVPCRNISSAFRDEQFTRISHKLHPGWSRVYARVLVEGRVETGLTATLLPPADRTAGPWPASLPF
jgi:MOSC domain-containing protein YiiM